MVTDHHLRYINVCLTFVLKEAKLNRPLTIKVMAAYNFVPKMTILILTCLPTHYSAFNFSLETIKMKFSVSESFSIII